MVRALFLKGPADGLTMEIEEHRDRWEWKNYGKPTVVYRRYDGVLPTGPAVAPLPMAVFFPEWLEAAQQDAIFAAEQKARSRT